MNESTRVRWAKRISQWKKSGLTAKQFAPTVGTTASTLLFYNSQLRRPQKRSAGCKAKGAPPRQQKAPQFIELMSAAIAVDAPVELEIGGVIVRVRNGFDEATLKRVLDLVGAAK